MLCAGLKEEPAYQSQNRFWTHETKVVYFSQKYPTTPSTGRTKSVAPLKARDASIDHHQIFMNPTYTERQGQFLAYFHQYGLVNGCAPAEADLQRFFQITPPSVHAMVLTLERRGLIWRVPGQARSITLIVPPESLPPLKRVQTRPFKP